MNAIDFINKDLRYGDKVKVTIGDKTHTGFFGGYKCFDGTHSHLDYALYPAFYAVGKGGGMVRRAMIPGRLPYWGMTDIKDVEKIAVRYRHVAYINNFSDCYDASLRGAKTVVEEWKKSQNGKSNWAFYDPDDAETVTGLEDDTDIRFVDGGRYAVRISVTGDYPEDEKVITDGDCPWFVDVYERVDE